MLSFAARTTPRVLELFDTEEGALARANAPPLPQAGHEFYTEQTVDLMQWWLPEDDHAAYRPGATQKSRL